MVVAPASFIKSWDQVKSGDGKNVRMQQRGDETDFFPALVLFLLSCRCVVFFGCLSLLWVAMAASAGEVRHLFRALLREASRFPNYNVREYVKRRAIDAFHQYRDQSDPAIVDAAFKRGLQQLEIARRQSLVYSLYGPRVNSIMDLRSSK